MRRQKAKFGKKNKPRKQGWPKSNKSEAQTLFTDISEKEIIKENDNNVTENKHTPSTSRQAFPKVASNQELEIILDKTETDAKEETIHTISTSNDLKSHSASRVITNSDTDNNSEIDNKDANDKMKNVVDSVIFFNQKIVVVRSDELDVDINIEKYKQDYVTSVSKKYNNECEISDSCEEDEEEDYRTKISVRSNKKEKSKEEVNQYIKNAYSNQALNTKNKLIADKKHNFKFQEIVFDFFHLISPLPPFCGEIYPNGSICVYDVVKSHNLTKRHLNYIGMKMMSNFNPRLSHFSTDFKFEINLIKNIIAGTYGPTKYYKSIRISNYDLIRRMLQRTAIIDSLSKQINTYTDKNTNKKWGKCRW